jgi:uncharacterized protein with von Willebrand factor type A (vWA) domain
LNDYALETGIHIMKRDELNNQWKMNIRCYVEQDINSNKIFTEILKKYLPYYFVEEENICFSADFLITGYELIKKEISKSGFKKVKEALKILSENSRVYGNAIINDKQLSIKDQTSFMKRSMKCYEISNELSVRLLKL